QPARPPADRPAAAGEGRRLRPGPGGLPEGPPRLRPVPRPHRGGVRGLVAADPGLDPGQPRPPLPRHAPPTPPASASPTPTTPPTAAATCPTPTAAAPPPATTPRAG